ncbi:hypothetical protein GBAR_LOCUS28998 [Geodia barretti]|uniref:Uncharacterized protein n=1 Tax=Geodia barretti TaxID=519541 RepID=A0AA35XD41_GEOBA|nr:hypothetical protein GBAR_LOCUS28998 [Geodia barretti]
MAKLWAFAFLVVALCATGSRAQEESSKDKPKGSDATTEYPTLSPPPPPPDPLIHNLQFSLPIVTVCILLFIMMVIVIVVMRKARYGQFCCLKPVNAESGNQTPPPTYKVMEMIAPPDYTDALQDVLVSQSKQEGEEEPSEETREGTSTVEVPLEDNEAEDDRTPLNP